MKPDTPLDYAVFQLSPKRTRCELFVSSRGDSEKVASGLVKPFVSHLKSAEEQFTQASQSIRLEVERRKNAGSWFTKGSFERFVRFVNTPDILETVTTFDFEMSQLEAAQKIYSQGSGEQTPGVLGEAGPGTTADATKKELLRAIDLRLSAVKKDLTAAFARAADAGFNPDTVTELQLFSDHFGANYLCEACTKFISVCQRRLDLCNHWKPSVNDQVVRSSWGSDMSIDDLCEDAGGSLNNKSYQSTHPSIQQLQQSGQERRSDLTERQLLSQTKSATSQQLNSSLSSNQQIVKTEDKEEKKNEEVADESPSQQTQPTRRLSVQDRINMFENKQKETSGGKSVVVVKPAELRRLSSDISSSPGNEKAVLRRWSGVSDMNIDLVNDKKDNMDSPSSTPSSSSMSQNKSTVFPGVVDDTGDHKELNTWASSVKVESVNASEVRDQVVSQMGSIDLMEKGEEEVSKGMENWNDQTEALNRFPFGRGESFGMSNVGTSEEKFKVKSTGAGSLESKDQVGIDVKSTGFMKNRQGLQSQSRTIKDKLGDVESRDEPLGQLKFRSSHARTRSFSGQVEENVGGKAKEILHKEAEIGQSAFYQQGRSSSGEIEQPQKDVPSFGNEPKIIDDSRIPITKVQKAQASSSENLRKPQSNRDESSVVGNKPAIPSMKIFDNQETFGTIHAPAPEQINRVRQSKGNQELNDELKIKANELEKLFAEHKLRIPGEQSTSTSRNKPVEMEAEHLVSLKLKKGAADISSLQFKDQKKIQSATNVATFSTPPAVSKTVDNLDAGTSLRHSFSDIGFSDDNRGKFYEKYMEKRDIKLREEWLSKKAEKEAKLKAMQDTFEQSAAEMKARFSRSLDRLSNSRHRAEKLRSFNTRSNMKREQLPMDFIQSEDDEDISEFLEQRYYDQDKSFGEISLQDPDSRSFQRKKLLTNKTFTSSTLRTSAVPVSNSLAKTSIASSAKQRAQLDNPLLQSVPNFSDFRKENTRPTLGAIKAEQHSKGITYSRSKSNNEDIVSREEKPRRAKVLRKSSAIVELPPLNPGDDTSEQLRFDMEQREQSLNNKFSKNVEPKPFLRKGSGRGAGLGANVAKLKAPSSSEAPKNEEEFGESPLGEKLIHVVKEKEEEEFETTGVEDSNNLENGKQESQEYDKISNSESENGDSRRSLSQFDPVSVAEVSAAMPSTFNVSMQDSPGESPISWNLRMHNQFLYSHETSDVDVSVDSSIGSPTSLNSQYLTQTDVDAARMRKRWDSAQKPLLVANPSQTIPHKEVTKGFKRLLKFGRKSRGTENLADLISVTTSEGDDDTEDGPRDPASRSSDDVRKSRMGFLQSHPYEDVFNEGELFNDPDQVLHSSIPAPPANFKMRNDNMSGSSLKAPRSFFSLSTFRSKGSESKLR